MHIRRRRTCRVCGSPLAELKTRPYSTAFKPVIDLGVHQLQGSFVKPEMPAPPQRTVACRLVRCDPGLHENACGLLQLSSSVPPEILYASYWYRSDTTATMRDHLGAIAADAFDMVNQRDAAVLDIGCNDGTLLAAYPLSTTRYGIDPSNLAEEAQSRGLAVVQDTFPSAALRRVVTRQLDIVTSIAMFYDLEDPTGFAREIESMLAPTGVWIFEQSYMPRMLDQLAYDTICHEHLEYYSLAVIEWILRAARLKLVRVELNSINGGSIRCYATRASNTMYRKAEWQEQIETIRRDEFDRQLDTPEPYVRFQKRAEAHKRRLQGMLADLCTSNKVVHGYGASTKGNTILQWCGISNTQLPFIADRNPAKHGARTLGTNISIVSEEESRAMKPDYYLVLPWHFRSEIVERERGGETKLIFPLPTIDIVSANGHVVSIG